MAHDSTDSPTSTLSSSLARYRDFILLLVRYARTDVFDVNTLYSAVERDHGETKEGKPDQMARDLEKMGPTFVKLGQVLSSRPDLVAPAYIEALSRLQDEVEEVPFEEIEAVLEQELGAKPSRLFETFDEKPIAAASLGQVHRARLESSGRDVVVKVQRPGIRSRIESDLEALESIAAFMDNHLSVGKTVGFGDLMRQFRQLLVTELNYRNEARNLEHFKSRLEDVEDVVVPTAISDFTTGRVLTMELVSGTGIDDLSPVALLDIDTTRLARSLIGAYLEHILLDGVFHADPHPGNVLITHDHKLALIDFGMVGYLNEQVREQALQLILALSEGRASETADRAIEIAGRSDDADMARFRREITVLVGQHAGAQVRHLAVGRLMLELYQIASLCGLRVPPEMSLLGKTLGQLEEIVRKLAPDLDTTELIQKASSDLTSSKLIKDLSPRRLLSEALDLRRLLSQIPSDLRGFLARLANEDLRLRLSYEGTNEVVTAVKQASNRMAAALVIAALIVGAALMMRIETGWVVLGYPGLAIVLFLLASACGVWLLWNILWHDRRARGPRG